MEGMGCVLSHPTSEQVRMITLPFPLPVQQVSQEGQGQTPSLASQLSVRHDASWGLLTLAAKW